MWLPRMHSTMCYCRRKYDGYYILCFYSIDSCVAISLKRYIKSQRHLDVCQSAVPRHLCGDAPPLRFPACVAKSPPHSISQSSPTRTPTASNYLYAATGVCSRISCPTKGTVTKVSPLSVCHVPCSPTPAVLYCDGASGSSGSQSTLSEKRGTTKSLF